MGSFLLHSIWLGTKTHVKVLKSTCEREAGLRHGCPYILLTPLWLEMTALPPLHGPGQTGLLRELEQRYTDRRFEPCKIFTEISARWSDLWFGEAFELKWSQGLLERFLTEFLAGESLSKMKQLKENVVVRAVVQAHAFCKLEQGHLCLGEKGLVFFSLGFIRCLKKHKFQWLHEKQVIVYRKDNLECLSPVEMPVRTTSCSVQSDLAWSDLEEGTGSSGVVTTGCVHVAFIALAWAWTSCFFL